MSVVSFQLLLGYDAVHTSSSVDLSIDRTKLYDFIFQDRTSLSLERL